MLACLFLIESSSKLLVTRTCMRKSLKGFDFGHIQTADIAVTWP